MCSERRVTEFISDYYLSDFAPTRRSNECHALSSQSAVLQNISAEFSGIDYFALV